MTAEQQLPSAPPMPAIGERRQVLGWAWATARPFVGWVLAAAGAIALFVGWFGVSGESLTAKQIPYLVSAGFTGVALFIMAGVFLATDDVRRQFERIGELERKVDDLYSLFVADIAATRTDVRAPAPAVDTDPADVVALPNGASYHRADCALVAGKAQAVPVTVDDVAARGLRPCRVCEPVAPTRG
jgi:hypothetical protein